MSANAHPGSTPYYFVPAPSSYPALVAFGMFFVILGAGQWINGHGWGAYSLLLGLVIWLSTMYRWFSASIAEDRSGLYSQRVDVSFRWSMSWFIFSEVMFFAAFFGALFYARTFAVAWLGGEGDKGLTGDYLWPAFTPEWPVVNNPDPSRFTNPNESMAAPGVLSWASYLPFWNTVILLTSSVTVHFAHTAIKDKARGKLLGWLGLTVILGVAFLLLQAEEYIHAYNELGLTLGSGIYGSTFYILTGFHGFHVTLGTFILLVQLLRAFKGHFAPEDCFGFESASWYWHFVDVVWVCLFIFVYVM